MQLHTATTDTFDDAWKAGLVIITWHGMVVVGRILTSARGRLVVETRAVAPPCGARGEVRSAAEPEGVAPKTPWVIVRNDPAAQPNARRLVLEREPYC